MIADYKKSNLWQKTLASKQENDDAVDARDHLRQAYIRFREQAEIVVNEIHRDHPDFTVHNITHSNALWRQANLIAGPNVSLTPTIACLLRLADASHIDGSRAPAFLQALRELNPHNKFFKVRHGSNQCDSLNNSAGPCKSLLRLTGIILPVQTVTFV
ncbi:MAG: hypothetical protein NVSMB33_09670 [Ktedonobacteraceae bacterium]